MVGQYPLAEHLHCLVAHAERLGRYLIPRNESAGQTRERRKRADRQRGREEGKEGGREGGRDGMYLFSSMAVVSRP